MPYEAGKAPEDVQEADRSNCRPRGSNEDYPRIALCTVMSVETYDEDITYRIDVSTCDKSGDRHTYNSNDTPYRVEDFLQSRACSGLRDLTNQATTVCIPSY